MGSLMKQTQQVEKNKRYLALGVTVAGVAITAVAPVLGVPLLIAGGYFGWEWFKFRAKNGMRF
jgi:predicted MFS family arabinose efflux permease